MSSASASVEPAQAASSKIPNLSTVVWRSLTGFRALHMALAAGIAAATAVIVGALLVGDSMRGSLKSLALDRLGSVHMTMFAQRFFDPAMLEGSVVGVGPVDMQFSPAILLPSSTAELKLSDRTERASNVQVLGVDESFWKTTSTNATLNRVALKEDEVAISAALAEELHAKVGDELTIRFPKNSGVPADSPLGRRDDAPPSLPGQRIAVILPERTIADFDLRASQSAARNVFVPLNAVQDALEQPNRVNAAFGAITGDGPRTLEESQLLCDQMNARTTPTLRDFGLKVTRHTRKFPDESIGEKADGDVQTIFDYFQITSDQMIIDDLSLESLLQGLNALQPRRALSYLVNEVVPLTPQGFETEPRVTYSIITGLEDWESQLTNSPPAELPFEQRPGSCGVNSWLAERLSLQPSSSIRVRYFRPETIEGTEVEVSHDMTVTSIVPITAPKRGYVRNRPAIFDSAPKVANDPDLTPVVPGITDQDSISKWNVPFELTRKVPEEDDDYWNKYRLTPKLFMRYNAAVRLFGSRFGNATALRIRAVDLQNANMDEESLRRKAAESMLHAKAGLGLHWFPLRAQQLKAASGTTPFDGLFLALSFFVIIAALMLVALLFRLSIEQRSSQWGLLMASGFTKSRVRSLVLRESFFVIVGGVILGLVLGIGYARLMMAGLESWWAGAVSGAFLSFHITPLSLAIGALIGGATSLITIFMSLRRLNRQAPLDLLRGRWDVSSGAREHQSKAALAVAGFLAFGAVGLLIFGMMQNGMAQAGSFFGCGMCLLVAALCVVAYLLRASQRSPSKSTQTGLLTLAWLALTRNPWRSVLSLGLLAVASFLIASMSVFQIAPTLQGSGGFELMAESSLPLYKDLGAIRVREEQLSEADFDVLRTSNILSFRERPGEDASCNNLYQVAQPTVLGIPESLAQHQSSTEANLRFQWAATSHGFDSPWQALAQIGTGTEEDPVPVVMDLNTAAWSLHQGASIGAITKVPFGDRVVHFRTVGLLNNSIMQGKLLISEYNFRDCFQRSAAIDSS